METKHTKGEWHTNSTGVFSDSGRLIANCVGDGIYFTDEDKANARLIAAAPDLLGALIKVYTKKIKYGTIGTEELSLMINAINKTTE